MFVAEDEAVVSKQCNSKLFRSLGLFGSITSHVLVYPYLLRTNSALGIALESTYYMSALCRSAWARTGIRGEGIAYQYYFEYYYRGITAVWQNIFSARFGKEEGNKK